MARGTSYIARDGSREYEAWRSLQRHALIKLPKGASANAIAHWNKTHKTIRLGEVSAMPSPSPVPSSTSSEQRSLYTAVNIERCGDKLLRWMIVDRIPFAQVESEAFRSVLTGLYAHPLSALSSPVILSGTGLTRSMRLLATRHGVGCETRIAACM